MQHHFRIMKSSERNDFRLRKASAIVMPALLLLSAATAQAQEAGQEVANAAEQETAVRYSVLYLEQAVPVSGEIDFELPPPGIPQNPELDPEFQERMQDIQQFNESITDSEIMAGAWDNSLVEQLN